MKRSLRALVLSWAMAAVTVPAAAQVFDRTGNGMLSGNYYFRHAIWYPDAAGNLVAATTLYGTITFDGKGNYTVTGTSIDSSNGLALPYNPPPGTYSISASGYGFLKFGSVSLYGLVSNGVFFGSSTDDSFNNLFIAVQASGATNATFHGEYRLAYLNFPTGSVGDNYDALATLSPDGAGNIGNVPLKYYVASAGATEATQNIAGVKYSFNNGGVGTLTFPTLPGLRLQGTQLLLISPDGNFIFGGGAFDFFIGVRRASGDPPPFAGLYYLAGVNQTYQDATTGGMMDTYFGSLAASNGTIIGHQRFFSRNNGAAQNYTYTDTAPDAPVADYVNDATLTEYFFSPDGGFRLGFGKGPYLGLSVAMKAPPFSGPGVYLNPTGVVNGASSAPFTAGIARGELLTLYGSNLAGSDLVADSLPLPTTLGGVQVKINNRLAPIYYVSAGQIAAIVPYGTVEQIAQIQVFKDGAASNAVTLFVYDSAPGVFTVPPGGAGYAAARHANYTLVSPDNPGHAGDYLQIYMTGLGDVFPTIQDGAPGPLGTLSETVGEITGFLDVVPANVSYKADVTYAGLAPTLPALYQVNLQLPEGVPPGDAYLDIAGPGAYTSQALIPVAESGAADARAPGGARGASAAGQRRR